MADSSSLTLPFKVLFEDQHLLVLSKSPNLLSQGDASGEVSLVDLLRIHFGRNYVGLIHRLDRNTSGLMVVAKRSKSADRLSEQLKSGDLKRKYHALLYGEFESMKAVKWEHFLLKNEKTNEVKVVPPSTPGSKSAALQVIPLLTFPHPERKESITLSEFELETGRSHQIRVQSQAMHHPLIGDSKYGTARSLALFHRPALHSWFISFQHPMSQEPLQFEEAFSEDLLAAFPVLSLKFPPVHP